MRQISASIEIEAGAERVWQVLTDFAAYPQWLPLFPLVTGAVEEGGVLTLLPPADAPHAPIQTLVLRRVVPCRELAWSEQEALPGAFSGTRRFVIEPLSPHRVRLVQSETFAGLLGPLLAGALLGGTRRAFARVNEALKARAEQASGAAQAEAPAVWPPPPLRTD